MRRSPNERSASISASRAHCHFILAAHGAELVLR
jgi:hypothetical protein